jgi:hypothetical protein
MESYYPTHVISHIYINGKCYVFFWCLFNYDVTFKIMNRLKVNNDNYKFNCDFKNHITIEKTPGEY